jgi:hypothetical protein
VKADFVSLHTGRDMRPVRFFYPSFIPNGIGAVKQEISVEKNDNGFNRRAVRHVISVEKVKPDFVSSHTGRDISRIEFFYPSFIPNGIDRNSISEIFKELAI